MGKLQPNFSWQKYEGKPEDWEEQFQYQLQNQHIQVSNSVNATIDDESFFTRERQTSFTWVNSKPIFTKTLATVSWTGVGTVNTIPMGITGYTTSFQIVGITGWIADGTATASNTYTLPYVDAVTAANSIGIARNGTNIVLTSGGTNYSAWSGYITIYYIKI